jgi:hypothetical protein
MTSPKTLQLLFILPKQCCGASTTQEDILRKVFLAILAAGAMTAASMSPADASGGCGPYRHRTPAGYCRPPGQAGWPPGWYGYRGGYGHPGWYYGHPGWRYRRYHYYHGW